MERDTVTIRKLKPEERSAALDLAWKVFQEYESPDYPEEGTEMFRKSLHDESFLAGIAYYGAFEGSELIGMTGIRTDRKHICFFFIEGKHHRRGIGRMLFKRLLEDYAGQDITLNSSPYGLPFYKALGFAATDNEQIRDGIRFTPMILRGENIRLDSLQKK